MIDQKMDRALMEKIVRGIVEEMLRGRLNSYDVEKMLSGRDINIDIQEDIASREVKSRPLLDHMEDPEAMQRMIRSTTARIGVGSAGPRLKTQTMLALRADHARACDAVMMDVDQKVIDRLDLFTVQTLCGGKNEYLTRPDLGMKLCDSVIDTVKKKCEMNPDVQLIVADGLSSTAINANIENVLPMLTEGLRSKALKVGTPFFVKYGRVAVEDHIAEILGAKVVCIFVGERPGLGSAESMSAYLAYNARVGMPEARRTVVSNIHKDGITAVEAGAYLTDLIEKILEKKASGVELQN